MFVVGLFLGPLFAVAAALIFTSRFHIEFRLAGAVLAVLFVGLLVAPVASLEFRIGAFLGGLLGLLLVATPLPLGAGPEADAVES